MPQNGQLQAKRRDQSDNQPQCRYHYIHSSDRSPLCSTETPSLDHHADAGGPRETSSAAAALQGQNWEDFSVMIATETTKGP